MMPDPVGFTDEPQPAGDLADLHALEAGALVPIAWALYVWGVPWIAGVFTDILRGVGIAP